MPKKLPFHILLCALFLTIQTGLAQSHYSTSDFFVPNGDLQLQVRKVTEDTYSSRRKIPILLIHGATGAITSFDLNIPDASFARSLADAGFAVYLMNIRGWERSTAPVYNLTDTSLVAASCQEAAADIDAVVSYLLKDNPQGKINLFGWANGGHWASYYTALHNEKVAHLIVLNSLYGVKAPWIFDDAFADPADASKFNYTLPVYRQSNEQAVTHSWQTGAEPDTTAADSVLIKGFAKSAISFNEGHLLKTPGGFQKESFNMAHGKKYWDAKNIRVPTLVIRGNHDFWSRPIDLDTYYDDLQNAPVKKKITLSGGNHFIILDRNSDSRRNLIIAINNFIKKGV